MSLYIRKRNRISRLITILTLKVFFFYEILELFLEWGINKLYSYIDSKCIFYTFQS